MTATTLADPKDGTFECGRVSRRNRKIWTASPRGPRRSHSLTAPGSRPAVAWYRAFHNVNDALYPHGVTHGVSNTLCWRAQDFDLLGEGFTTQLLSRWPMVFQHCGVGVACGPPGSRLSVGGFVRSGRAVGAARRGVVPEREDDREPNGKAIR